jgi:putative peptide zinc metalloprotease protein
VSILRRTTATALVALLVLLVAPAAGAQERTGDDNVAVAVNTEDGATIFRLAFSIRRVADGVVDQTNTSVALASCADCQTIALAFQVVFVRGDADVVAPENLALAYNDQCVECVTYASATQIVLGFDGNAHFTSDGYRRLTSLHTSLRELEDTAADLTLVELNAEIQAAKLELLDILSTQLVEVPTPPETTSTTTSSTTTTEPDDDVGGTDEATTTTSTTGSTSTSTSAVETTTTSTTEPETTTTVAP